MRARVAAGMSTAAIARELGITAGAVNHHRRRLKRAEGVNDEPGRALRYPGGAQCYFVLDATTLPAVVWGGFGINEDMLFCRSQSAALRFDS